MSLSFSHLPFASLLFSAICKASSDNHFALLHFFFLGSFWLFPAVECYYLLSIVFQVLCLPDLIPWIYFHFHCIIRRDLTRVIPEWSSGFPYSLHLKPEFANQQLIMWATVSSRSCFCWLSRVSPSLAAKNVINLISVLTIWWCPGIESPLVLLEEGVCYDQCILLAKLFAFALLHSVLQG